MRNNHSTAIFVKFLVALTLIATLGCGGNERKDSKARETAPSIKEKPNSSSAKNEGKSEVKGPTSASKSSAKSNKKEEPTSNRDLAQKSQQPEQAKREDTNSSSSNSSQNSRQFGFSANENSDDSDPVSVKDGVVTEADGDRVTTGFGLNEPQKEVSTEISTTP